MKHQKIAVWKRCDGRETEVGDLDLFCQPKVRYDSASLIDAQIQSSFETVTDRLTPGDQPVTAMIESDRGVFLPGFGNKARPPGSVLSVPRNSSVQHDPWFRIQARAALSDR